MENLFCIFTVWEITSINISFFFFHIPDLLTGFLTIWATSNSDGAGMTGEWVYKTWFKPQVWFGLKVWPDCVGFRADCLTVDLEKPKPKFVKEVLEKSMRCELVDDFFQVTSIKMFPIRFNVCSYFWLCRLSYHQRIVDIVPPTFSVLIPAEPIFIYKYLDETACKNVLCNNIVGYIHLKKIKY